MNATKTTEEGPPPDAAIAHWTAASLRAATAGEAMAAIRVIIERLDGTISRGRLVNITPAGRGAQRKLLLRIRETQELTDPSFPKRTRREEHEANSDD